MIVSKVTRGRMSSLHNLYQYFQVKIAAVTLCPENPEGADQEATAIVIVGMFPREAVTVIIPLVILMSMKSVLAVPKCLVGGESACASVAEWKENILCRIQGPGEGNARYQELF